MFKVQLASGGLMGAVWWAGLLGCQLVENLAGDLKAVFTVVSIVGDSEEVVKGVEQAYVKTFLAAPFSDDEMDRI